MATIDPTTSTTTTSTTSTSSTATAGLAVDSDMFMKLLVENLRHQDPMQPQDSSQYMAQLSQMSMVEKLTSIADDTGRSAHSAATTQAISLLGKTVTYLDAVGNRLTGVVQKVDTSQSALALTIGGVDGIAPSAVVQVS